MITFNVTEGEGHLITHMTGDNSNYTVSYNHGKLIFTKEDRQYIIPEVNADDLYFGRKDPSTQKEKYDFVEYRNIYRDTTPTDFGISDILDVELGSTHKTPQIVIGGVNDFVEVIIPENITLYINGEEKENGSKVTNGDVVEFEMTAPGTVATQTNYTINLGDISKSFALHTKSNRKDCKEWRDEGQTVSGIYLINPTGNNEFEVYCDMQTDGGGWTGIININAQSGNNRHYSDTSFWQADNTYGSANSFLTAESKNKAFKDLSGFDEIMIKTHHDGSEKGRGRWEMLPGYQNSSMYDIMNIAQSSRGTKITGNRVYQTGSTGVINNSERGGNSNLKCEFTDSYGGYELRVNWYGNGGAYAKYSDSNDTVNFVRLTTGIGDPQESGSMGYSHSFSGFGGHHERPAGSYVYNFDFATYTEYCGLVPRATYNQSTPCGTIYQYNIDAAIFVR
jgi:hypothetical protein